MALEEESIASDSGAVFSSRLTRETRLRLVNKFLLFQEDREKIRRRMESYVLDFQLHDTGATHKYETLEEQYSVDVPNLNHLVFCEDGTTLWSMRDIAIVLGRNVSNVARTFQRMRAHPDFARRFASLSVKPENPGRDAATLYAPEIFDAVVDYFEHAYLERVTHPRHGTPLPEEERNEVLSFWRALKENQGDLDIREYGASLAIQPGKTASLSTLYQCLRMIVKRAFSVRMGTFFLLLFAVVYELSRRYPLFNILVPVLSVAVLFAVLFMMPRRKWYTPWLVDAGACSVMFCLLWTLAVIVTPDSPTKRLLPQTPVVAENPVPVETPKSAEPKPPAQVPANVQSQKVEEPKEETTKTITPVKPVRKIVQKNETANIETPAKEQEEPRVEIIQKRETQQSKTKRASTPGNEHPDVRVEYTGSNGNTFDVWIYTKEPTKEILYRTAQTGDFRSTGFSKDQSPDGHHFPIRALTLRSNPNVVLYVKYIDLDGGEHGPYKFDFSLRGESVAAAREILSKMDWVEFSSDEKGLYVFTRVMKEINFRLRDTSMVSRIMYGINRKAPNMERKVKSDRTGPPC